MAVRIPGVVSLPLLEEFLSTFKEWHYFVVGLSLGFVAGYVVRDTVVEWREDG